MIDALEQPAPRVEMPRAPRLVAPEDTMHVVARRDNREFYFTTAEDFALLLAHLRELVRTYELTFYAYPLMSNLVHLLVQAPSHDALGRPLRRFLTRTARAFHRARGRRGHFWERHYRLYLAEEDLSGLNALAKTAANGIFLGVDELVDNLIPPRTETING